LAPKKFGRSKSQVRESLLILIKQSLGANKFRQSKSLENDNLSTQFPPKNAPRKALVPKN
jgi:hypothetical protein